MKILSQITLKQISICRKSSMIASKEQISIPMMASKLWDKLTCKDEIPGPANLPLMGSAYMYSVFGPYTARKFNVALEDYHKKYGKVFKEKILNEEFIYTSDPKDIAIMVRNEGKHPCRPALDVINATREQQGLPAGITSLQGEEWSKQRNVMNSVLMHPKSVRKVRDVQAKIASDFIGRLRQLRDPVTSSTSNLNFEMNKWALESVAALILDMKLGLFDDDASYDESRLVARKLNSCMNKFFDLGARLTFGPPIWRIFSTASWRSLCKAQHDEFKYAKILVDKKLSEMKCPMKQNHKSDDDVTTLIGKAMENKEMSKNDAVTLTLELLAGGIDTTATCSLLIMDELARNPQYQEQLREKALSGDTQGFSRLLRGCIYEAMRLRPMTYANARKTDCDLVMGGFKVPAGSVIRFTSHLMNLKNEEFFPQPEKFRPERWSDKNSPLACKDHFAFMPFGHGARQCPGRRLAIQEMDVLFMELVTNFQIKVMDTKQKKLGLKVRLFNCIDGETNFVLADL